MSFALYDFTESLARAGLDNAGIAAVEAAWGGSPEGYGSWEGGFFLRMTSGRWAYLTGWCDTTGWGCQDGVDVTWFDERPDLATLKSFEGSDDYPWDEPATGWELDPADLNRFLHGKIDEWGNPSPPQGRDE